MTEQLTYKVIFTPIESFPFYPEDIFFGLVSFFRVGFTVSRGDGASGVEPRLGTDVGVISLPMVPSQTAATAEKEVNNATNTTTTTTTTTTATFKKKKNLPQSQLFTQNLIWFTSFSIRLQPKIVIGQESQFVLIQ